jgi:hypothetical protein
VRLFRYLAESANRGKTNVHMDVCACYVMGKKRLIVDLQDVDHAELVRKARDAGLTVSNFVRQSCGPPLEHQGKKRAVDKGPSGKRASKRKSAPKKG